MRDYGVGIQIGSSAIDLRYPARRDPDTPNGQALKVEPANPKCRRTVANCPELLPDPFGALDASKRESRRVVAQGDPLQCAKGIRPPRAHAPQQ